MKLPNWIKIVWWLLLLGFFAYLLSQRYDSIMSGATSATDIVIFLIFIALLAIPLFQEVSLFGVSFKKEIDNLRTEFREQIVNLRSDIQNTINMRAEISPHIYFPYPHPDSELPSIEQRIKPILEQALKERGIKEPPPIPERQLASDNAIYLFSVRYAIDKELRRITRYYWISEDIEYCPRTLRQMLDFLVHLGTIDKEFASAIREVYAVCSAAIHGEDVSDAKVQFVREVYREILHSLLFTRAKLDENNKE